MCLKILLFFCLLPLIVLPQRTLTLNEAIAIAHSTSPQAQITRLNFMSRYWNFRSYKARFLPSLNLSSTLANYNRSMEEVRDYNTGNIRYISNNTLSNDLTLSLDQNIAFTGGKLSFNTNLYRLEQFTNDDLMYYSRPFTVNYSQSLRAFNDMKWQKRAAPLEYEQAKRSYLEEHENITIEVTSMYFNVLAAQTDYERSVKTNEDNKHLYGLAKKRLEIGRITETELMELELSMLNGNIAANNAKLALDKAKSDLCTYLCFSGDVVLSSSMSIPSISLDYKDVLERAYNNSTFKLNQDLKLINASKEVRRAKSLKGMQLDLNANFGASQSGNDIPSAYRNLKDQEIVGVSLRMPIFDWGLSRGQVKIAQAEEKLAITEAEQEGLKFQHDILFKVAKFNNQAIQCEISCKAAGVAEKRYAINYQRFVNGSLPVADLNTARQELEKSQEQYIDQLRIFWETYYELQKLSLYDYINRKDISAEFDKVME